MTDTDRSTPHRRIRRLVLALIATCPICRARIKGSQVMCSICASK